MPPPRRFWAFFRRRRLHHFTTTFTKWGIPPIPTTFPLSRSTLTLPIRCIGVVSSRSTFGSPPQIGPIPGPLGNNFESSGVSDYFRLSNDYTIKPTLLNHFLFSGNWTRYLET